MKKEYIVIIDDTEYDIRNEDDRLYLESIGYFDKKESGAEAQKDNTIDIKEDDSIYIIEDDTETLDLYGRKVFDCPMNTDSKFLKDKAINYKWYALFSVNSKNNNIDTPSEDDFRHVIDEHHRYIYYNEIKESIDLLADMSNGKKRTVLSNLKKLHTASGGLVTLTTDKTGKMVYKLNYATHINDNDNYDNYITISSDILQLLAHTNSNVVKIYCILMIKCNYENWTKLSDNYFSTCLGINRSTVNRSMDILCLMHMIKKEQVIDTTQKDVDGNILVKTYNQYKIAPYAEFRQHYEETCKKRKRLK